MHEFSKMSVPRRRLEWLWRNIASIAISEHQGSVIYSAIALVCLELAVVLVTPTAGMAEPYADFGSYLTLSLKAIGVGFCILVVVLAISVSLLRSSMPTRHQFVSSANIASSLLGIGIGMTPVFFWFPFGLLRTAAASDVFFFGPGGKPDWCKSRIVEIIGSPMWIGVIFLGAYIGARAVRPHNSRMLEGKCRKCGYHVLSISGPNCPECGNPTKEE